MKQPRVASLDVPYVGHPEQTHRITYYTWGEENAPTVLCVHGLTRNAHDFDFLADRLSNEFRVIAIDMPGRGKSEWLHYPEEYNLACYMANMLFFLDTLKIGPAHWIGTSMGGMLGMVMAAQQPERIRTLVLNDIGAQVAGSALARIGSYVGKVIQFPNRAAGESALREIYAPFGIRDEAVWQNLFTHDLEELPGGAVRRAYDPAIGQSWKADPAQPDMKMWELWEQVRCPTLLIRGEKSDILTADTAEKMRQTYPGMQLHTVPGVGHAPTLADEAEIDMIDRFIKQREYTSPGKAERNR